MVSLIRSLVRRNSAQKCSVETEQIDKTDKVELLINLSAPFSHDEIYQSVKDAISKKPEVLEIDLVGLGILDQGLCLSLWYLLTEKKDPKTHLIVCCNANLIDGEVLVLLAADEKQIRPRTWMEISSLKKYEAMDFSTRSCSSKQCGSQHDEPFFLTDYRNVFEIMNRYLPCELLSKGRVEIGQTFREYGLLNNQDEELSFQSLFNREEATV
ncbi:MAG: hypothetical protein EBQ89_00700 [Alphaproteobacteria bacterium]|nr:hypothetical protein [Alphaproteobacteria bacterium]